MHFCVLSETHVPEEASHMGSFSSCPAQQVGLTLVLGGILGRQGLTGLSLWNDEMTKGQRRLREEAGIRGLCHYWLQKYSYPWVDFSTDSLVQSQWLDCTMTKKTTPSPPPSLHLFYHLICTRGITH